MIADSPTSGPWYVASTDITGAVVRAKRPMTPPVAHCITSKVLSPDGIYTILRDEALANAHMCAASPDLYMAVDALLSGCTDEAMALGRAAMAKARGIS